MNKKRILIMLVVLAVLCALIYLQVRAWKQFDWNTFLLETEHVNWLLIFAGVVLTYAAYALRAVRWKIFLKPVCKTTSARLLAPQFIGFTALALLGRAGEVVRPYIIARKENLTFASQMAVWMVERIFDMGAFAVLLALSFLSPDLRALPFYQGLRQGAFALFGLVLALMVVMIIIRKSGEGVGNLLHGIFARSFPRFAHHLRDKIRGFSVGLETIHGVGAALQLTGLSILMWLLIVVAYICITHAYLGALHETTFAMAVLLMGASMVGSLLQLPGVGGGSQLATIGMLSAGFGIPHELAVSCGMLIWAATFMSVVPAGLLLAHRERISLRAVEKQAEEKTAELAQ
jgi:uncharacterized protein (TIRG00374 family)